ncbi:TetR family transcriptional regulator [Phycicoccus sp. BSK3Z-2]|uniref:TetR family transcriptional regulator n=1 Tax=Phycicoccus avicenniae TaxID=2828860 RepID=A0A941D689_9MICO|nr:TetR family transcriptional regulator [Phycicoccus avicenniae]MBR7742869.1 TetR family transcriptional regulator [Phycicoccus avicenniae]
MARPRRPGDSRIKITVASIADTALAMIREAGVDSLTMRALAARLGVSAPALYHHVAGREELLDLVARRVPADSGDTETSLDSVTTIEEYVDLARPGALAMRDYYLGHPGLARVMLDRVGGRRTDTVDDRDERTHADVEALTRTGLEPAQASATFDTLARWTLAAIAAEHDAPPSRQSDESFAHGLDLLLTGLTTSVNQALTSEDPETRR